METVEGEPPCCRFASVVESDRPMMGFLPDADYRLCRDVWGDVHLVEKSKIGDRFSGYVAGVNHGEYLLILGKIGWDFPGGGCENLETVEEAARRELAEETEIDFSGSLTRIVTFVEYFFDIDTSTAWRSNRTIFVGEGAQTAPTIELKVSAADLSPLARLVYRTSPARLTTVATED